MRRRVTVPPEPPPEPEPAVPEWLYGDPTDPDPHLCPLCGSFPHDDDCPVAARLGQPTLTEVRGCLAGPGWWWYCDEHDVHGTAHSRAEAEGGAAGHEMYWDLLPEEEREECHVSVVAFPP